VLGRGLRIPIEYKGEQPVVTVYNHYKWSSSIRHLVNEVLEIEKKLYSYPIRKEADYNFELHNIDYKKSEDIVETPQVEEYDFSKGFISLSSQAKRAEEETVYERAVTGIRRSKSTRIEYEMYPAGDVAQDVLNRLRIYDMEAGTAYSKKYDFDRILEIMGNSLERIGEKENIVNQENKQKILQAFGVIKRPKSKSLRYKIEPEKLVTIKTENLDRRSMGVGALRGEGAVFYDENSLKMGEEEDRKLLESVIEMFEDGQLHSAALTKVTNTYNFKTPSNVVFTSFKPERDFVKRLVRDENAKVIDAWIKSPDVGFYSIEYSWRKGEHPKQGNFNPDFFIKLENDILVVEIKTDGDISNENRAKLKYARAHFERLNKLQSNFKYYLKFLSPESYDHFFQALRSKKYQTFISKLEANLE
jgi:type III restriction enzyme